MDFVVILESNRSRTISHIQLKNLDITQKALKSLAMKQKQTDSSGIESMCRDGKKKSCMNSLPHFHGFLLRLSEQGMEYRWRHWWTNESLWQNPKVNPATPRPLKKTGESTKESPEMGSSGSLQPHLRLTSEPCKLRTDPKQLSKRQKIQD